MVGNKHYHANLKLPLRGRKSYAADVKNARDTLNQIRTAEEARRIFSRIGMSISPKEKTAALRRQKKGVSLRGRD